MVLAPAEASARRVQFDQESEMKMMQKKFANRRNEPTLPEEH